MANHAQTIEARVILITLMLREDHQKGRQLFDQFDESTNQNEKRDIVTAALAALEVHATLEEELIYPAWREHMDEQELMDEVREEGRWSSEMDDREADGAGMVLVPTQHA
ncbi:MAG: hemerythrin domain-containing protein [Nitrospiraceae bacterium]